MEKQGYRVGLKGYESMVVRLIQLTGTVNDDDELLVLLFILDMSSTNKVLFVYDCDEQSLFNEDHGAGK